MQATNMGSPFLTSAIQYIINVVLTLPAILYVDKWGRRSSLLSGSMVMMISLFIVGALEKIYGSPVTKKYDDISWQIADNKSVSWTIVILTYIFVGAFAVTWGVSALCFPAFLCSFGRYGVELSRTKEKHINLFFNTTELHSKLPVSVFKDIC